MSLAPALAVRTGTPLDLSALSRVDALALPESDRAKFLRNALATGQCIIADSDAVVAGLIVLNYEFFGFGFIPLLVVAPPLRRQGIALKLLAAAEARCRARKLFTSANESNVAAQALFQRAGFTRSGIIENLDTVDPELVYFKACQHAG